MNIVVLDGYTLNPGDLNWAELQSLGACQIYDRTGPGQILARAANAEIVLTNKVVLSRDTLNALPQLRYVGVLATGYNVVDVAAARQRNIPVTNVPGYSTPSVTQHTFALLLELAAHVGHHAQTVRDGRWSRSADFCYWDYPLLEISGLTLGVVGFGQIGREVTKVARAFGLRVLVHTRTVPAALPDGVEHVALDELFARADMVSLHCPLTPDTSHLVNAARLERMKPAALLINTSRGPLVDEAALANALNAGRLAGAALDVLATEPPQPTNPLLTAKNCLITPHLSWATRASRERLMSIACANIRAFLAGQPQNLVN